MSKIIDFPVVEDRIWVCLCGCSTFKLIEDGSMECSACGNWSRDGSWYEDKPAGGAGAGAAFSDVQGNGSVEFARAHMRRMASDPEMQMVAVARPDGSVSAWFNVGSEDERKWMHRRLDDIRGLLDGFELKEGG